MYCPFAHSAGSGTVVVSQTCPRQLERNQMVAFLEKPVTSVPLGLGFRLLFFTKVLFVLLEVIGWWVAFRLSHEVRKAGVGILVTFELI